MLKVFIDIIEIVLINAELEQPSISGYVSNLFSNNQLTSTNYELICHELTVNSSTNFELISNELTRNPSTNYEPIGIELIRNSTNNYELITIELFKYAPTYDESTTNECTRNPASLAKPSKN